MRKCTLFWAVLVIFCQIGMGPAHAKGYRCVFDKEGYYTTISKDEMVSKKDLFNKNAVDSVINFEIIGNRAILTGNNGAVEIAVISSDTFEHFIQGVIAGLITYTIFKEVEMGKDALGRPAYAAVTSRHVNIMLGTASIGQYFGTCSPTE